jgi:Uracil DNA glycosylase superfamily
MSIVDDLHRYYSDKGILSTSFTCAYKAQCQSHCADFTGPKSAFVSTRYEDGTLPRLLFISLDSGSGDKVDEHRLPVAVRQANEFDRDFSSLAKHKHWYRTHELAWYILRRFDPALTIEGTRHYFAHANSAKCCMNKPQRKKANTVLFRNCKGYLAEEFEILNPAIVVTQGKEAKYAFLSTHPSVHARLDDFASVVDVGPRRHFWLHTYHPNNWGAFNRQRAFDKVEKQANGWLRYSDMAHDFVLASRAGAR